MTTYNTYAEAKIANPMSQIFWYLDEKSNTVFTNSMHRKGSENNLASPAKFCMSLDAFLEAGYKFVDDDLTINSEGRVYKVGVADSVDTYNTPDSDVDGVIFVLSAKALEEKVEQVEWKNGDECVYTGNPDVVCKFASIHPNNPKCAIVWEGDGDIDLSCVALDCLSKPETPEQKKEREELEAAYDLYRYAKESSVYSCSIVGFKKFISDSFDEDREEYLHIVRKTGYRKPE